MPRFVRFLLFFFCGFAAIFGMTACESISNGWKKTKSAVGFADEEDGLGPRRRPVGNPGGSIGMPATAPRDSNANQVFGDPYPSAAPTMQGFIPPAAPYAGASNFPAADPYNSRYPNFSQTSPTAGGAPIPAPSFGNNNTGMSPPPTQNYQAQPPNIAAPQAFGAPSNWGQFGSAPPSNPAGIPTDINGMPSAAWAQESAKQSQQWVDQFSRPGALNQFLAKYKQSARFEPLSGTVYIAEGDDDPFLSATEDLPAIKATDKEISPLSHPIKALKKWREYPSLGTVPAAVARPNDKEIFSDFKNLRALNNNATENQRRSFSDEDELLPPLE